MDWFLCYGEIMPSKKEKILTRSYSFFLIFNIQKIIIKYYSPKIKFFFHIFKTKHLVLQTVHPSPLSAHRGFLECSHWSKANAYLKSLGKQEIEWDCLTESD